MITPKEITDLRFQYDVLKERNKDYVISLREFLASRGVTPDEIKRYLVEGAAGLMKPRLERGQQGFEHKGDVSIIDKINAEAAEAEEMTQRESKLKLWAKFINHQYAAWSALFELITGFKPPKMKEVAAIISGH